VALLLCATVAAQAEALAGMYGVHHATEHCCVVCHMGPLPFLRAPTTASIAPVLHVVWLEFNPHRLSSGEILPVASASRAPPA